MLIGRFLSCLVIMMGLAPSAQAADLRETVVVLHGIARTQSSMQPVEHALQEEGYETLGITYPSTDRDLDGIAAFLRDVHLTPAFWQGAGKVHIVSHSMGGLVARRYLDAYRSAIPENKLGRVVMLAPPNGGSEVADLIHELPPYRWFYGPAGDALTTEAQSGNKSDIFYDLGIIAGNKEWPYVVAAIVTPGESDGRVTVEKTKLAGMKDHVVVNGTHTFIMHRQDVHQYIVQFLKRGDFGREE
ncbi:MAG: esterase/lipase family protein [Geminicoccaceae bacterium]